MEISINHWEMQNQPEGEFTLIIPSSRGFFPYKKFREAVAFFYGKFSFERAMHLAQTIGDYVLADEVVKHLRRARIKIAGSGRVPYMSLRDYLDSKLLAESAERTWRIDEIKEFLSTQKLDLLDFDKGAIESIGLKSFWAKHGNVSNQWIKLEIFDILCSHRNPYLKIRVRNTRQQQ